MCCPCTCVDEASRSSLAELFRFVRQCDLHNPGDVPRRRLDTDSVWCDQLRIQHGKRVTKQQQMIPPHAL